MAKKVKGWLDKFPQAQMGDTYPLDASQAMSTLSTLGEVFSIPQKVTTKLITGKYQAPSEALGIKNPYGQFATDAILDPTLLAGIGYKAGKPLVKLLDDVVYENFRAPKTINKLSPKNIKRELGERIGVGEGEGGQYNQGVYNLKRFPQSVVKFENPLAIERDIEFQNYDKFNFVEAMKNIPDNSGIAKVRHQFPLEKNSSALIMDKVDGVPIERVSPIQLRKIPEEAIKQLYQNVKTLRNNNLGMDFIGNNIVYSPQTKKFGLFDIDPGDVGEYWMDDVHQGMSKHLGDDVSANNIKKALEHKLVNKYWSSVDKNIIEPSVDQRYLDDQKVEKLLVGGKDFLRERLQKILGPLDSKQSGGNIPGSVGFTYARTQSPAPSNGKYAKKTMPSAQNGQEMKFYQEGLDWKPKNISQWGGDYTLDANQAAQTLTNLGDVMSAPQQGIVKALTGKYQTPSEAMNVTNPYGKFAIDTVLDPINLVGIGLAGKVAKASTKSGILSNMYKINPFAFKSNPEAYYRGIGEEGYKDALKSGVFRQANAGTPDQSFSHVYYGNVVNGRNRAMDFTNDYMVEVPKNAIKDLRKTDYPSIWEVATKEHVPISKGRILKKDWLQGYKEVSKKQDGGVIEDDRGQWEHPGEITKINSNQITMKGVDYPVLGISNTGDTQMMFPNQEYSYKGDSVTEYPMMQEGGTIAMNKVVIDPRQWMDALSRVQKKDGSIGMWGNPVDSTKINRPIQQSNPIGYTDHRGVRSGQKYQGSPSTSKLIELKEKQLKAQSSRTSYEDGGWLQKFI